MFNQVVQAMRHPHLGTKLICARACEQIANAIQQCNGQQPEEWRDMLRMFLTIVQHAPVNWSAAGMSTLLCACNAARNALQAGYMSPARQERLCEYLRDIAAALRRDHRRRQ